MVALGATPTHPLAEQVSYTARNAEDSMTYSPAPATIPATWVPWPWTSIGSSSGFLGTAGQSKQIKYQILLCKARASGLTIVTDEVVTSLDLAPFAKAATELS